MCRRRRFCPRGRKLTTARAVEMAPPFGRRCPRAMGAGEYLKGLDLSLNSMQIHDAIFRQGVVTERRHQGGGRVE